MTKQAIQHEREQSGANNHEVEQTDEVPAVANTRTDLRRLADGLSVQYSGYLEALTELIDNSVAAVIEDESYFGNPSEPVQIEVTVIRDEDIVWTTVADNGPGIPYEVLRDNYFVTGDRSASSGILNNMGWGSGNSLSWFEHSLSPDAVFELLTSPHDSERTYSVTGPVAEELEIRESSAPWHGASSFNSASGTLLRVPTSRKELAKVYPLGSNLSTTIQYIRQHLGVIYRRVIDAHPESAVVLRWEDRSSGSYDDGRTAVIPIWPCYSSEESEEVSFEVDVPEGRFEVQLEHGLLDLASMKEEIEQADPALLNSGGNFRCHYIKSQKWQGVDVYANGRIIETSVFGVLWNKSRHNTYNLYGGQLTIKPKDMGQVPTDNKKTGLDKTSELWSRIVEELRAKTGPYKIEYEPSEGGSTGGSSGFSSGQGDGGDSNGKTESSDNWAHSLLVSKLAEQLESESNTESVLTEKDYGGVVVDVVQELEHGGYVLWEVKTPDQQPGAKNAYHLLMYHDHFRRTTSEPPEKVVLLSSKMSGNGRSDLNHLDGRLEPQGDEYRLVHRSIDWLTERIEEGDD